MAKNHVHKKDTSQMVVQRDKIKDSLEIKDLVWTEKQKNFIEAALDKETKIMFVNGPAGSSKSILATYCALNRVFGGSNGVIRSGGEDVLSASGCAVCVVNDNKYLVALVEDCVANAAGKTVMPEAAIAHEREHWLFAIGILETGRTC